MVEKQQGFRGWIRRHRVWSTVGALGLGVALVGGGAQAAAAITVSQLKADLGSVNVLRAEAASRDAGAQAAFDSAHRTAQKLVTNVTPLLTSASGLVEGSALQALAQKTATLKMVLTFHSGVPVDGRPVGVGEGSSVGEVLEQAKRDLDAAETETHQTERVKTVLTEQTAAVLSLMEKVAASVAGTSATVLAANVLADPDTQAVFVQSAANVATALAKHTDLVPPLADYTSRGAALIAVHQAAVAAEAAAAEEAAQAGAATYTAPNGTVKRTPRPNAGGDTGGGGATYDNGGASGGDTGGGSSGGGSSGNTPEPPPRPTRPPNPIYSSRHLSSCPDGEFLYTVGPNLNSVWSNYVSIIESHWSDGEGWWNTFTACAP